MGKSGLGNKTGGPAENPFRRSAMYAERHSSIVDMPFAPHFEQVCTTCYHEEEISREDSKMGTLGWQETVVIFVLALLLFGPKKLPELGKTIGKAITEFRRASNELKATFDREMKSLESENESLKAVTQQYQYDTYNYDYSSYDSGTEAGSYTAENYDSNVSSPSTSSASATQGAESTSGGKPEGTVAHGTESATALPGPGETPTQAHSDVPHTDNGAVAHAASETKPAEHKA
jgi:sec-independent protein translocase protein TatA